MNKSQAKLKFCTINTLTELISNLSVNLAVGLVLPSLFFPKEVYGA